MAEGWDDWGPFYTPMYSQHIGLNGSTVEMCRDDALCGGRAAALEISEIATWSTLEYDVANREDLLHDELEIYERGVEDAARPECCPPPFDVDNNWMEEYPDAYVIPLGDGQRSDPEANRLVEWLLFNGIEVEALKKDAGSTGSRSSAARTSSRWTRRAGGSPTPRSRSGWTSRTGSAALRAAGGLEPRVPLGRRRRHDSRGLLVQSRTPSRSRGRAGSTAASIAERADAYALEVDSATAVRTLNQLVGDGASAEFALESFTSADGEDLAAGSVIFAGERDVRARRSG